MTPRDNIVDRFGRIHNYLRISITEQCNLRCFYCMPAEGPAKSCAAEAMSRAEIFRIAEIFTGLGVKKIRLTGGEPLVRKDAAEVISDLSRLPVELTLTTNGVLVDRFIDTFVQCGIRSVNVSLDSLNPSTLQEITRRDRFDRTLRNIRLLLEKNIRVKLNAVIMRGVNAGELVPFVEFTKHHPVHFRFIEFMPFEGNSWDWKKGIGYEEIMDIIRNEYGERLKTVPATGCQTSKDFRVDGYAGSFGVISPVTHPFCSGCNRVRITANGKLKNCLFSGEEADLLQALRNGGDVEAVIREAVMRKHAVRGGMDSFARLADPAKHCINRSMVAIGG